MSQAQADTIISDFSEKREKLNEQANRHRELRDRLNDETKKWANHRDALNAQVREIIDTANQHKARRDSLNKEVKAAKAERDELNRVANDKAEELNSLKRERMPRGGATLGKLKQQLRELEYEHQTKALSPKKEKEHVERMKEVQKELKQREQAYEEDEELGSAYEALKEAKANAEAQHKRVTELANEAQEQHDTMVGLFNEADKHRKEADQGQEMFVKSKVEADKVHHEYIEIVNQIRDLDRVVNTIRGPQRGRPKAAAAVKEEAQEIFERFKSGEKLSTEDLMNLQKAGLI